MHIFHLIKIFACETSSDCLFSAADIHSRKVFLLMRWTHISINLCRKIVGCLRKKFFVLMMLCDFSTVNAFIACSKLNCFTGATTIQHCAFYISSSHSWAVVTAQASSQQNEVNTANNTVKTATVLYSQCSVLPEWQFSRFCERKDSRRYWQRALASHLRRRTSR